MSGRRGPQVDFVKRRLSDCPGCSSTSSPLPTPSLPTNSTGTAAPTVTSVAAQTSTTASSAASQSPVVAAVSSTSDSGTIAGCVIGSVVFLVLVVLGILLYLRARKRKRTPPSCEYMNALKAGATPVLRLDSGAEYTATLPEKGGCHPHAPPPRMQNAYYPTPPMPNMTFPAESMASDIPSGRPSIERPLHPQRFSHQTNDSFVAQHHPSMSIGSRRELLGSDIEIVPAERSSLRHSSPHADSVLQFMPYVPSDEPSAQPPYLSHSPTSLQPRRRQPDPESDGHL